MGEFGGSGTLEEDEIQAKTTTGKEKREDLERRREEIEVVGRKFGEKWGIFL